MGQPEPDLNSTQSEMTRNDPKINGSGMGQYFFDPSQVESGMG
jgi:hypothetical protein